MHSVRSLVSLMLGVALAASTAPASPRSGAENASRSGHGDPATSRRATAPSKYAPDAPEGAGKASAVGITATKSVDKPMANPGDTLAYTVVVTNSSPSTPTAVTFTDAPDPNTTLVPGSVHVSPIAVDETYNTVGNTQLAVGMAPGGPAVSLAAEQGVLSNDVVLNNAGGSDTIAAIPLTNAPTANAGTVTLNANGTFLYTPRAGFAGTDTFTYTIKNSNDATLTSTGLVTISVASQKIWYVNNAVANGNGTSASPFNSLTPLNGVGGAGDADAATDTIYVSAGSGSNTTGIELENGQALIGQGVALQAAFGSGNPSGTVTLQVAGATPTITNSSINGHGVKLASGNTLSGLTAGTSSGVAIFGSSVGALSINNVSINTTGAGLDLTGVSTPTVNVALLGLTSSGGAKNVNLVGLNGTVSLGGGALSGATTSAFDVSGAGTANISYSGTIANTTARSVNVASKTGGTVAFSGAVSGSGTGISLTSNTGATINFTGGLSITTGTSAAFTATGGGTVSATQNPGGSPSIVNVLSATSATALNVANTTIGASGLTFKSISSGNNTAAADPASGIVLNNTGGVGLTVTGTGNSSQGGDASGGTIQHTTGDGISLASTTNPSFTNVKIQTTFGDGIDGTLVNGFTFANGTIDDSGTGHGANDSNIGLNGNPSGTASNVSGTVSVTNSILSNAYQHGIDVLNYSGLVDSLTVTGNALASATTTANSHGSAIRIQNLGSTTTVASLTKASIIGNTIKNFPSGSGLVLNTGNSNASGPANTCGTPGDATKVVDVKNNAIMGASQAVPLGSNAIAVATNGKGVAHFNVDGNGTLAAPVQYVAGNGVSCGAFGNTTCECVINNNVFDLYNIASSAGINTGADRTFAGSDHPTLNLTVTSNRVMHCQGNGILATVRTCSGTGNFTIKNNNVDAPFVTDSARPGIRVDSGNNADVAAVCLTISGNTSAGSTNAGTGSKAPGIGLRQEHAASTCTFGLSGLTPNPSNDAQMAAFVNTANPGSQSGTFGVGGTYSISSGATFVGCSSAPPLMLAEGSVPGAGLAAFASEALGTGSGKDGTLRADQLPAVVEAALKRWAESGLAPERLEILRTLRFRIATLDGSRLGEDAGGEVVLDRTARGMGWFVDGTPDDDAEFGTADVGRRGIAGGSAPTGRVDLLTAVMHEMGHRLGLSDSYDSADRDQLMYGYLAVGERRMPRAAAESGPAIQSVPERAGADAESSIDDTASDSARVTSPLAFAQSDVARVSVAADPQERSRAQRRRPRGSNAATAVAPVSVSIPSLPGAESVTIHFAVTINNPLVPANTTAISNTGSGTSAAFGSFTSNTVTTCINRATPTITGTPARGVCAGSTGNTASTGDTLGPWTWTITGGTITSATNIQTITYTAGALGSVTLKLKVGTAPCEVSATDKVVTINANPATPSITAPTSGGNVCINATNLPATASGTSGATTVVWSVTNGLIDAGQGTSSITYHPTGSASQTLTINLMITNAGGCTASATPVTQTIVNPPATPVINAPASVCAGSTGNTATTTAAGPWAWSITNGSLTSAATSQTVTFTAGASGSVTLNLSVGTAPCATAASPASVTINPVPIISAPASVCPGDTGKTASGTAAGTWTITNGVIDAGQGTSAITFHVTGGSGLSVTLGLTAGGCTGTASVPINGSPTFSQHPTNQTACLGATATFTAAASGGTYQWYRGATALVDGAKYGGVTTSTLSIFDVGASDAVTDYNVVATGCVGSTTSNNASLAVDTTCFDSTFAPGSDPARDWTNDVLTRNTWSLDGAGGYAAGTASSYGWGSISHAGAFADFDYEVAFSRTGTCLTCATALLVRGTPAPTQTIINRWNVGYQISITRDGRYSIYKLNGLAAPIVVQPWTATAPAVVNANGANVVRVRAIGSMLHLFVNHVEVAAVPTDTASPYASGHVGVGISWPLNGLGEVLTIDRARLAPSLGAPKRSDDRPMSRAQRRLNREAREEYARHPERFGTPEQAPERAAEPATERAAEAEVRP